MSFLPHDINDDEIRIISSKSFSVLKNNCEEKLPEKEKMLDEKKQLPVTQEKAVIKKPKWKLWLIISAIIFFGGICVFFWWEVKKDTEEVEKIDLTPIGYQRLVNQSSAFESMENVENKVSAYEKGYVVTFDTVINKVPLSIFIPKNAVPKLHIGTNALRDSTAVFVVQAADIRKDNGLIVGSFVLNGDLLSKGQAKAGFCAIINGKIFIGVADSTPYLEQAIETGGYFFRQYPLVVGGQIVENKLKSSSLRKALAELNGEIVVVMNDKKQTLNEFSQTLVDLGVSNAIYLIGSTAPGFAVDERGEKIWFGKEYESPPDNSNYIIWE